MQRYVAFDVNLIKNYIENNPLKRYEIHNILNDFDENSLDFLLTCFENKKSNKYKLVNKVINTIKQETIDYIVETYLFFYESFEYIENIYSDISKSGVTDMDIFNKTNVLDKADIVALLELAKMRGDLDLCDQIIKIDDKRNEILLSMFIDDVSFKNQNDSIFIDSGIMELEFGVIDIEEISKSLDYEEDIDYDFEQEKLESFLNEETDFSKMYSFTDCLIVLKLLSDREFENKDIVMEELINTIKEHQKDTEEYINQLKYSSVYATRDYVYENAISNKMIKVRK